MADYEYRMIHGTRVRFAAPANFRCKEPSSIPIVAGHDLWAQLHRRGLATKHGADDGEWLMAFRRKLPCGGCRKHWDQSLVASPPDWNNYFAWTVAMHNEVNARLGKPLLSVEQARERWQMQPPPMKPAE